MIIDDDREKHEFQEAWLRKDLSPVQDLDSKFEPTRFKVGKTTSFKGSSD